MNKNTNISYFSKMNDSSFAKSSISLNTAFNHIKNNPHASKIEKARNSGKYDESKPYKLWRFGENVDVNLYDYIKNEVGSVTWSVNLKDQKRKKELLKDENLTGLIYYDIDNSNLEIDELISRLKKEAYVVAVWKSYGGKGIGFLVHIDGLKLDNFVSTWTHYKVNIESRLKKNENDVVVIDKATKDFTRVNVLSYDENIYVNPDYYSLTAKQPKRQHKNDIKVVKLKTSPHINNNMKFICDKFYHEAECNDGNRLTYIFYRQFFSHTNWMGVDKEDALNFLIKLSKLSAYDLLFSYRDVSTVENFALGIYGSYESQFGTIIEKSFNTIEGEIEDINIAFLGTAQEKKDYVSYFMAINNIYKLTENNASFVAINLKEKGIEKNLVFDYFQHDVNEKISESLNYVYDNPFYMFGVIVKKNNNRNQYIVDLKKQGLNVNEHNKTHIDKSFLIQEETNIIKKIIKYANKCIENSIDCEKAIDFYICNIDNIDNLEQVKNIIIFHYQENDYKLGISVSKKIIYTKEDRLKTFLLKDDEYLSHLNLDIEDNTIVWSDTNTGKTTYLCTKEGEKQIVLVPVIPLLEAIENNHKCSVFYGERKNIKEDSDLIICTFSSAPKLFKYFLTKGWDFKDYTLNVDEWQNFITASAPDFREEDMNFILDKMHFFKKRIMWTGTYIKNCIPEFNDYNIIRVKKSKEKKFNDVLYTNKILSCEKLCDKDGLNLIYLQSKKIDKELGNFKRYFIEKGWKDEEIICLNNNHKNEPFFEKIIKNEVIEDHVKIVFCTSLVAEGLNFNNKEVSSVHFCTKESPYIMEQVVNRFRKTVPKNIFLYRKYKEGSDNEYFEGIEAFNRSLIENTEMILKAANSTKNYSFLRNFSKNINIRQKNDYYVVNYLTISYEGYLKELNYANKNIEYMKDILSEYSWVYSGEIIVEDDISSDLKKKLKNARQVEKNKIFENQVEIKKEVFATDIETIKDSIREENVIKLTVTSKLPDFDFQVRKNIVYLNKYLDIKDVHTVIEQWQDNNFSSLWYKRFLNQFKIQRQEQEGFFEKRTDYNCLMAKELRNKFYKWTKEDKKPKFLKSGIINLVNSIREKENKSPILEFDDAKKILLDYFVISTVLDKNSNVRYEISAINLLNEEIEHYHMFNSLIKSALGGLINNEFTKESIWKYTKNFRSRLSGSNYIDNINGISESDAFKMLNYYCDLKNVGKGIYKIVPCPRYNIEKNRIASDEKIKVTV